MKQSPIFLKCFDTLVWLLEHTRKFPKHQRFVMAKRIEEAGLGLYDNLIWATKTRQSLDALRTADFHLERLRAYNRLSVKLQLLSFRQHEYLARELDELGRLLGGWQRKLSRAPAGGSGGVGGS